MSERERLQTLMSEIGPLIDGIEAIDQEDDDFWLFALGDNVVLQIQHDEEARKLVFSTELGTPPTERRLEAYEALLAFNYLWLETGGVRMAIESPGGEVTQVMDLFTLDLDISTLATVIQNFREKAIHWRGYLANFPAGDAEDSRPTSFGDGTGGPAIRV